MIIQLEQAATNYNELKKALSELHDALRIEKLTEEKAVLDADLQNPDVYSDLKKTNELSKKLKSVSNKIDSFNSLSSRVDDVGVMIDLCREEEDEGEAVALLDETKSLADDIENLKLVTLLSGKYDEQNAILSLHAGAGGTEAQDWCEMLYRMYTRYAEKMGFSVKEVDYLAGDDAGIKSVTFMVMGENAYGYLKAEMGVHRLVRISPFDANARRHTSFASLEVMPEVTDTEEIEIKPEDLKIDTFRSSGAGGQHVNRTESAIRITHLPTGIVVSCQNERSQVQNKELAMRMLFSKLTEKREQEILAKEAALKGDVKKIEWGSQIRSYVFCPYTLVKDHRTGFENTNVQAVMDGDIQPFILDYLRKTQK